MDIIKQFNERETYRIKERYEIGDIVEVVGLKKIIYGKETAKIYLGTKCKVIETIEKDNRKCGGKMQKYCNLSSYKQCLKIESIEENDKCWSCYAVVQKVR